SPRAHRAVEPGSARARRAPGAATAAVPSSPALSRPGRHLVLRRHQDRELTAGDAMSELQPSEVLCIPKRKRLTHGRFKNEEGQEVLHLFYGEVELIFDEPDVAPVGEKLIAVERFRAEEAMAWSNGAPHAWDKIRDLLQALLDQQVLKRAAETPAAAESFPPRLGLAPDGREPMTFSAHDDRCPALTEEA